MFETDTAEPVEVIFRVERSGPFRGEVTAVFPAHPGTNDPATFTVYQHVGQHSTGTLGWYRQTRAAAVEEAAPLAEGLGRLGYDVFIRHRMTKAHYATRKAACKGLGNIPTATLRPRTQGSPNLPLL